MSEENKQTENNVSENSLLSEKTNENTASTKQNKLQNTPKWLSVREIVLFPMLGTLMYISKVLMASLPNIHLIGMFIILFTVVFRAKALIPIYIYIFLEGVFQGFSAFWVPYLYIWAVLWAVTILLPKNMPKKVAIFVYPAICCLHGLLFGTMFAPVYCLIMGIKGKAVWAWIINGLPYDAIHAAGNLVAGCLVVPLIDVLKKLMSRTFYRGRKNKHL